MAFEDLITRINLLLNDMGNQPEDAHELLEQIHLELAQMRAANLPLPEDLLALESGWTKSSELMRAVRNSRSVTVLSGSDCRFHLRIAVSGKMGTVPIKPKPIH